MSLTTAQYQTLKADILANQAANVTADSSAIRRADGFCLVGQATVGSSITVYRSGGVITGLSSLTPGVYYYLSATAGAMVTATTASAYTGGQLIQRIGIALTSSTLSFEDGQEFLTS